ncbi:hypothetical protein RB25_12880 [Herbaspirillum rubrisubalbicans]|uniref:T6SS effector BTH_I2691 family protein n=1 Tax=Herbaspirillum rubrisubalbicans TaxID=80842 RepID=UPI000DC4BFF9|nr:T6SS effector BTH_I2691 family protein [Herbaspirillum rubrisubalbicans]RAN48254.1 hypothetical protein RB25_12880 [Herbaspirillum rubrisubalbicans]
MNASATATRDKVIGNAINATAGPPPLCVSANCQTCRRADLQLLIVTPSVAPLEHAATLQRAGHQWSSVLDTGFAAIKREATVPVARLARSGYFMLYFAQSQRWDIWQVMGNGLARKIMHQVSVKQYAALVTGFLTAAAPKTCSRGAANLEAPLISINGAKDIPSVWLAYTPRLWSPPVLQRYADNPMVDLPGPDGKPVGQEKLRTLRGREIHPAKWIRQSEFPQSGCLPLTAANLEQHVADFVKEGSAAFVKAFEFSLKPLDKERFGQAAAMDKAVRATEKLSHPTLYVNKSLLVMLPDDVGVIEQHNHLRLCALESQKAWVAGGPHPDGTGFDPLRSWKLRSALHVEMIESWVVAARLADQKTLEDAGGYRHHHLISEDELEQIRARERASGKAYYPIGTKITRNDSKPVTYRVTPPPAQSERKLESVAEQKARSRIERYHGKLRMEELEQFRQDFRAGMARWETYLAQVDVDHVRWLTSGALAVTLRHDFDERLSLRSVSSAYGSAMQQVFEYLDRLGAVEKAWGGGAISLISSRELARTYGKDPEAPVTWLERAMLEPWDLYEAILSDPGKRKDVSEKINGLVNQLPEAIKEVLQGQRNLHEAHVHSLLQVQEQAVHLQATLLDPKQATRLGAPVASVTQVQRVITVQIRTAAIMEMMINPAAERYVTISVKLPIGEALDAMVQGVRPSSLGMTMETKVGTDRKTRHQSRDALRKLAKHQARGLQLPEYFPVVVTERKLAELKAHAGRQHEQLVEVVGDGQLGHLSERFQLPKSTALKLLGEQASLAKASRQALWSRQGKTTLVLASVQMAALTAALNKLDQEEGDAYVDTLMSVMGSTAGLLEGAFGISAAAVEIRRAGNKLVLSSSLMAASVLRLLSGVAGAAASGFDMVAAYAKYRSRLARGETLASTKYRTSSLLFAGSFVASSVGVGIAFANATVSRFVLSRVIVAGLGGATTAGMIASTALGIGIVVGVAAFAVALYAESLEDDLNEVFLKRCYWGKSERGETRFAADEEPSDKKNMEGMIAWCERGLAAEVKGFQALSVGVKASLTWSKNFGTSVLEARIEAVHEGVIPRVAYSLQLFPQSLGKKSEESATMTLDAKSQRYILDIKIPLDTKTWNAAQSAHLTYRLYEEVPRAPFAQDAFELKRV